MLYPDDRHWMWRTYNADGTNPRDIYVNTASWINGYPTHDIRFSANDPAFFTVCGPFDAGAKDANTIATGSAHVEISLGKLDSGLTTVQGWARVTNNSASDYLACAWIDQGTVIGTPRIGLSADTLRFTAVKGGANPDSQTVQVNNIGGGTLSAVTVAENAAWLTANLRGTGNAQRLVNYIALGALDTGNYQTTVTVSGGGASNTAAYTVKLRIALAPRQLTSITVSPDSAAIAPGGTSQFTAATYDQYGAAFAAIISWTASGGGALNPATSGSAVTSHSTTFTSNTSQGAFLVIATAGALKDTARVRVTSDMIKSITLTEPVGGTVYRVGDVMHIRWTASAAVTGVTIRISPDRAKHWGYVFDAPLDRLNPGWINYAWTITPTVPSTTTAGQTISVLSADSAVVSVTDYDDGGVYGRNAQYFTIKNSATVLSRAGRTDASSVIAHEIAPGMLRVSVPWSGAYRILVCDLHGTQRAAVDGAGAHEYYVNGLAPGVYSLRVYAGAQTIKRSICVSR